MAYNFYADNCILLALFCSEEAIRLGRFFFFQQKSNALEALEIRFLYPIVFIKDICEYSAFTDVILADDYIAVSRCLIDSISVGSRIIQVDNVRSYYATARYCGYICSSEHRSETSSNISTERDQICMPCLYLVDVRIGVRRVLVSPSTITDIANVVVVVERFFSSMCVTATALLIVILMPSVVVVGKRYKAVCFPLALVSTHTLDCFCRCTSYLQSRIACFVAVGKVDMYRHALNKHIEIGHRHDFSNSRCSRGASAEEIAPYRLYSAIRLFLRYVCHYSVVGMFFAS